MRDEDLDLVAEAQRKMNDMLERSSDRPTVVYPPPVRTPIGVTVLYETGSPVVVCDDGSVFQYIWGGALGWHRLPPIPGTLADR